MASIVFDKFKQHLFGGLINLHAQNTSFKLALFNPAVSNTVPELPASGLDTYSGLGFDAEWVEVASGGGYTTGGKVLGHCVVSESGGVTKFDNTDDSDTTWTLATFTARIGVLYKYDSGGYLIRTFDFGENKTVANGTFAVNMNASGVVTAT
jgi:hypothetical protein